MNICEAALASVESCGISVRESIRLLSRFDNLFDAFLGGNSYSVSRLRECIRCDVCDDELFLILDKCTLVLEDSFDDLLEMERYIEFVSLIIDARFLTWYVKGEGVEIGSRISRLTAIISRYRRALFSHEQGEIKSHKSSMFQLLSKKIEPRYNGRVFFHEI